MPELGKKEELLFALEQVLKDEKQKLLPLFNLVKEVRKVIKPETEVLGSAALFLFLYLVNSEAGDFEKKSELLHWILEGLRNAGAGSTANVLFGPSALLTLTDGVYRVYDEYIKVLILYTRVRQPGYVPLLTDDDNEPPSPQ